MIGGARMLITQHRCLIWAGRRPQAQLPLLHPKATQDGRSPATIARLQKPRTRKNKPNLLRLVASGCAAKAFEYPPYFGMAEAHSSTIIDSSVWLVVTTLCEVDPPLALQKQRTKLKGAQSISGRIQRSPWGQIGVILVHIRAMSEGSWGHLSMCRASDSPGEGHETDISSV